METATEENVDQETGEILEEENQREKEPEYIKVEKSKNILPVYLTDKEMLSVSKENARYYQEYNATSSIFDSIKQDYKSRLASKEAEIDRCQTIISNGYENREVPCETTYDFKVGTKTLMRMDTMEVVDTWKIQEYERQAMLDCVKDEEIKDQEEDPTPEGENQESQEEATDSETTEETPEAA